MGRNALVIMAKSPGSGDVKTRLSPRLNREQRIALYTKLLNGTVERLKSVKVADPLIAYTPADSGKYFERYGLGIFPQAEGDLGIRISNAIEHVLGNGYDSAVIVGSDIPGLGPRIASSAFSALRSADLAIGPSTDGGYYLIGMKAPRPELFDDIKWSTNEVLKATVSKARQMGLKMEIIDILDDIDTPEDMERLGLL